VTTQLDRQPEAADTPAPGHTGSTATAVLGGAVLLALALWGFLALVGTPVDAVQGDAYRLIFLHVPIVVSAYLTTILSAVASGVWLWKRTEWWDVLAAAAAELAAVFTAATLVSGSIWAGASWGVLWVWDARVTSTALLFLVQLGYLAVRRVPASFAARARRSAVLGLLFIPNIVVINQAVSWWRSVHQPPTLMTLDPDKPVPSTVLFTLYYSMAVAALTVTWLMFHRFRIGWLADRVEERGLEDALAERRREVA
jgi:heme exporter protein C